MSLEERDAEEKFWANAELVEKLLPHLDHNSSQLLLPPGLVKHLISFLLLLEVNVYQ